MGIRSIFTLLLVVAITTTTMAKRYNEFVTPQEKVLNIQYIAKVGLIGSEIDKLFTEKGYLKSKDPAQPFNYGMFRPGATVWWNMKGHYHYDEGYKNMVHHTERAQPQISPDGKRILFVSSNPQSIDLGSGVSTYISLNLFDEKASDTKNANKILAGSYADNNTLYIYTDSATYWVSISDKDKKQPQLLEGLMGYVQPYSDGKTLYAEDNDGKVWRYDIVSHKTEMLISNACEINLHGDNLYFRRNSDYGISEIWRYNVKTGKEEKVLSSTEHGFTSPQVSPDGKYIAVMGNALSPITKKQNLDIFVAKIDGTGLRQLTDHPAADAFPLWSSYGNRIYFLSQRRIDGSKWDQYSQGWLYSMDVDEILKGI